MLLLEKVPKENLLQRTSELSTGKWVKIIWILPRALEMNNEHVDASLQQFETIALDINELSMHNFLRLQNLER